MIHHEGRVKSGTPFLAEGHIEFKLPDFQIHEIRPRLALDTKKPFEPVEPDIAASKCHPTPVPKPAPRPGVTLAKRDVAVQEAKA
jgi:hypothetical protein